MSCLSVYIFGASGAGERIIGFLRDKVQLLGYLDNDLEKQGSIFMGFPVLSPAILESGGFDVVVVCSAYHSEIVSQLQNDYDLHDTQIINTHALFHNHYLRSRLDDFAPISEKIACIVTGISYAMLGVLENKMSLPTFNFAINGQDIYYDYAIFKYVVDKFNLKNLHYVLINLTVYSLHYDLSRRKNDMVTRYSEVLGDFHNALDTQKRIERALSVIDTGYSDFVYYEQRHIYADYFKKIHSDTQFTHIKDKASAKVKMERISSKEHAKFFPDTFRENIQILDNFVVAVKDIGCVPIFFTVPGHPFYTANIPRKIESEFYGAVADICNAHNVPFLDMLRDNEFDDGHYYDDAHLNELGAALCTSKLDEFVTSLGSGRHDQRRTDHGSEAGGSK